LRTIGKLEGFIALREASASKIQSLLRRRFPPPWPKAKPVPDFKKARHFY
jgi:hypothetical protein